jgi:predicted nucleic acid-binding OB-fold protein
MEFLLSYTNISHVDSAIELLRAYIDNDAKEKLKRIREDVKIMFNDLTDNAKELFNVICKSKVVLSRS